jgi:hypothetical protein
MQKIKKLSVVISCVGMFILLLSGCGGQSGDTDDSNRGPIGKADSLSGSCDGACGGISDGDCYCDSICSDFGDCCLDAAEMCEVDECDLITNLCPEGYICQPGDCLAYCPDGDLGCCAPNNCVSEDLECLTSEDCPELNCPLGGGIVGECVDYQCQDPDILDCPNVECSPEHYCPHYSCPFGGGLDGECVDYQCQDPNILDCPNVECETSADCEGMLVCVDYKCI